MNAREVGRILAVVVLLDPKFPQPDEAGLLRSVWADMLSDVPYEDGHRAVRAYYRSEAYAAHREPISPADIVGRWNARRRPTEAERTGTTAANRRAIPAPPLDPERVRAGVDAIRTALLTGKAPDGKTSSETEATETVAQQRALRAQPCHHCGAGPNQHCVDVRGNRLTKSDAHPSRTTAETPAGPRGSADQARNELTSGGTA